MPGCGYFTEVVIGTLVRQRQHHSRQGDPVGEGMMQSRVDSCTLAIPVDQVDLPQRAIRSSGVLMCELT